MKRPDVPSSRVAAVAYLRVSTEDQAREGYSLEAQRARVRAYCEARVYVLIREFVDDGYSGRTTNRLGFQELMNAVREGVLVDGRRIPVGAVVVAKFDRLNRNLYDFLATQREMQTHRVHFASVDETIDTRGPFGRFFIQVIAAFAELESGIIGERVRHGMRQKALLGGFNGMSAPYGYDLCEGGLVVDAAEARVVRRICACRRAGKSLAWIAARLNEDRVPTKNGRRWTTRQVFRIVHNPIYRGSLHWQDIVIRGTHRAIVTWAPRRRRRPT